MTPGVEMLHTLLKGKIAVDDDEKLTIECVCVTPDGAAGPDTTVALRDAAGGYRVTMLSDLRDSFAVFADARAADVYIAKSKAEHEAWLAKQRARDAEDVDEDAVA